MSDETHYGNFPKCPHCGHEDHDAWEMGMDDDDVEDVECGHCDKPYRVSMSVSITYGSSVIPAPDAAKGEE